MCEQDPTNLFPKSTTHCKTAQNLNDDAANKRSIEAFTAYLIITKSDEGRFKEFKKKLTDNQHIEIGTFPNKIATAVEMM